MLSKKCFIYLQIVTATTQIFLFSTGKVGAATLLNSSNILPMPRTKIFISSNWICQRTYPPLNSTWKLSST